MTRFRLTARGKGGEDTETDVQPSLAAIASLPTVFDWMGGRNACPTR